jgi:recombination protein RecA
MTISAQMKRKVEEDEKPKRTKKLDGNTEKVISTGSTLLDLSISGGRVKNGGLPGGILVEIFGPSSSGKTVLLCEIAGGVQRAGGAVMFNDPEARLNKQFARMFDLDVDRVEYSTPNTITEVFKPIREWEPKPSKPGAINGVFADSLAALSTDMEMEEKDAYGMRRAKEFSEELRKTCRILTEENLLMVCSNQIRTNVDAGPYAQKYVSPGGKAIEFYSSLRLRMLGVEKIKRKTTVSGKEVTRIIGVKSDIEIAKSSVWKPFHQSTITILFDYGIDDVRDNLQFVKEHTGQTVYCMGGMKLSKSIDDAIAMIEEDGLENKLKHEVTELWHEIESKFRSERKPKHP